MKWGIILAGVLALVLPLAGTVGCDEAEPETAGFNLEFKYGVTAGNILDTFEGTYTKDMITDPPITVELSLSDEEKETIYQKMVEIDFFGYPDEFSVEVPPGEMIGMVTPYNSYYFKVEYDSQVKELRWDDEITNPGERADRLRELIAVIRNIIESKEEYKSLPDPTSAYL
jgi:hypothetical protein